MRRFLIIIITALGLVATACGSDSPLASSRPGDAAALTTSSSKPVVIRLGDQDITLTSSLSGFAECSELLDHLRATGAEHVGPWGFEGNGWFGGPLPMAEATMAVDASASAEGPVSESQGSNGGDSSLIEGVDFSGTNVQEVGVDESDIIKTDGRRIYVVSGGQLVVIDVATREVVGRVDVANGSVAELFVDGDELVHITSGWSNDTVIYESEGISSDAISPMPFPQSADVTISRISVSSNGTPSILQTLKVDGDFVTSRAIDGTARIVLRSNPQQTFPFVYPAGPSGEDRAKESNRQALLESQLGDWLPSYTLTDSDGNEISTGLLPECSRVQAPTEFAGFGVVSVLTLPIAGAIDPLNTSAVLAPGETVYASASSLYVTTTTWLDNNDSTDQPLWQDAWDQRQTSIHRFDISSPAGAGYVASASVPGDVRDQFAMSEYNGHLRVVTSTGQPWDDSSETTLHVLEVGPTSLTEVGSVGDMGNGEAVQSVRFDGDVGYVVTFRQVDPFYTLDISDPTNPQVVGELKLPGFSSYLHPIGDSMVIGVGTAADLDGRTTGAKVSLFDVADLSNPVEIASWVAPDGWNDVGWEHRSFLWWEKDDIAVLPLTLWSQDWSGAVVLKVTEAGITELGRIDHVDPGQTPGRTDCVRVDPGDFDGPGIGDYDSELAYMISDGYTIALVCDPTDVGGATGYDCESDPWYQTEAPRAGVDLTDGQRIEICWPIGVGVNQISRSLMLPGQELWTLSSLYGDTSGQQVGRLQVNDLASLERLAVVHL